MAEKLCTIVGMGSGLSMAIARRFGREKYAVGMVSRRVETLEAFEGDLGREGIYARSYPANAGDAGSLEAAFKQMKVDLGRPEVLVYNVAAGAPGLPSGLDVERLVADFRVSVAGALLAAQQVIPDMREKRRGTILFTGGGTALNPWPEAASLSIGKAGLRSLALSLAAELEPAGIHVATVTIAGMIKPGTHFDPAEIAEIYWQLHCQPPGQWEREVIYR